MRRFMQDEQGETLIEILGATLLISLIVLGFVGLSGYSLQNDQKVALRSEAMTVAATQLELYRGKYVNKGVLPISGTDNKQVGKYLIIPHSAPLGNELSYSDLPEDNDVVSLQTIVYHDDQPYVITVSVTWEE